MLGLVIEKVTGSNYRDYITSNVFNRAGMNNSGFFSMDGVNGNTAEGYQSITDSGGSVVGYKKNIYSYPQNFHIIPKKTSAWCCYRTRTAMSGR